MKKKIKIRLIPFQSLVIIKIILKYLIFLNKKKKKKKKI